MTCLGLMGMRMMLLWLQLMTLCCGGVSALGVGSAPLTPTQASPWFTADLQALASKKVTASRFAQLLSAKFGWLGLSIAQDRLSSDSKGQPPEANPTEDSKAQLIAALQQQLREISTRSESLLGSSLTTELGPLVANNPSTVVLNSGRSTLLDCCVFQPLPPPASSSSFSSKKTSSSTIASRNIWKLKLLKSSERFNREIANQSKVRGGRNRLKLSDDVFLSVLSSGVCSTRQGSQQYLLMEIGDSDLKRLVAEAEGVRDKPTFRRIALSMARAVQRIHAAGLVWTDLKLDNFVVVRPKYSLINDLDSYFAVRPPAPPRAAVDFSVKAIDLESAVVQGGQLVDFSPEACSPETAAALSSGQLSIGAGYQLNLQEPLHAHPTQDIWALGVALLHLYTGNAPIVADGAGNVSGAVKKVLAFTDGKDDLGLGEVKEAGLRRLLGQMLEVEPRKRPGINQVLLYLSLL